MATRSKPARQRYQARLNLHDGMGVLWDYLSSVPERSRVHALIVIATFGAEVRLAAIQGAAGAVARPAVLPGPVVPPPPVAATATRPEVTAGPRSLDPVGAETASAGMGDWDFSSSFDAVAPMH